MTLLDPVQKVEYEVEWIVTLDDCYVPITLTDKYQYQEMNAMPGWPNYRCLPRYICIPTVPYNFMHVCFVNKFLYQTCQMFDSTSGLTLTDPKRTWAASFSSVFLPAARQMLL